MLLERNELEGRGRLAGSEDGEGAQPDAHSPPAGEGRRPRRGKRERGEPSPTMPDHFPSL